MLLYGYDQAKKVTKMQLTSSGRNRTYASETIPECFHR